MCFIADLDALVVHQQKRMCRILLDILAMIAMSVLAERQHRCFHHKLAKVPARKPVQHRYQPEAVADTG